jgi:hypothetical protein
MKKNYFYLSLFTALLCMASVKMSAQMSGVYTIDGGTPTGGTNYQTFSAFASALTANGIGGPITVNVTNMTYNEQVEFMQPTGNTAANRITINGNGATLTFASTSSGQPHTLKLNGTDYVTVNNLNVIGSGATYAMVCVLTAGANYNMFEGCTFTAPFNGSSTNHAPFVIGNATTPTGGGPAGDFNTVKSCTLSNGYYGFVSYGLTSSPWTKGNSVIDSRITDFATYGIWFYYNQNFTFKGNIVDRQTRTTVSTVYATYGMYTNYSVIEGNKFWKFFDAQPGTGSALYFYGYYQAQMNIGKNLWRNNIITDIKNNGTIYTYFYNGNWDIYHNTFDFDYAAGTSGTIYNLYAYSQSGYGTINIVNNIITMRRNGGTKYAMYFGGVTGNVNVDKNDIFFGTASGTNYFGYYTAAANSFAAWQGQGMDPNGFNVDPMYTSASDLHPTNTVINNVGTPLGVLFDNQMAIRNPSTPDIGALEFLTPICAGQPSMTVSGPTYSLCPGESADFGIGNLSSDLGYTYQWFSSTSSQVGPWTAIGAPSPTNIFYTANNVTTPGWYSAVISCTAPGGTSVQAVAQVNIAGSTTNTAPYYENFEGIGKNDRLPNCSWFAPNIGASAKTYTAAMPGNLIANSGNSFASFNTSGSGANYYYSNGIWLDAGVTYSASVWYMTDFTGATNWSNLAILLGTSQSPTGLTQIASTGGAAVSPTYKSLSNVFTVATSGLYYVAIRGTSSGAGAMNLSFDDLRIDIPCTPQYNTPNVTATANNITICSGQPVVLTGSGADTYTWSSGATGAIITENPVVTTNYMVAGTNSLTGCVANANVLVTVKQSPVISLFAMPPVVCSGSPVNLQASGAASYTWNISAQGSNITVNPTSNQSYLVMGTGTNGCTGSSAISVTVNPKPNVSANPSTQSSCAGDPVILSGNGGVSYMWVAQNPPFIMTGNNISVNLTQSSSFTMTGTDAKGCSNTAIFAISVDPCTGLAKNSAVNGVNVFPNPTTGKLSVNLGGIKNANVSVTDLTGRTLITRTASDAAELDLSGYAAGVYYVKIHAGDASTVVKVVRD